MMQLRAQAGRAPSMMLAALAVLLATLTGCGGGEAEGGAGSGAGGRSHGGRGGPPGGTGGPGGPMDGVVAVPVEAVAVERRPISSYIETNGTLEAENEVDVVARTAGPIVELLVEESMTVEAGQLLARIDDIEHRAQLEISRVALNETRLAFDRAQQLQRDELISPESYERAKSAFESARAQFKANEILLGYTEIRAPFGGWIIERYVNFAEQVGSNTPLFRISDFNPLLCPIRIPERELSSLHLEQRGYLTLEPFANERFEASVLRISPVVDAETGTIKVTLEIDTRGKLRPGMFARVFVETARKPAALVIPKTALSLESIGDTVYVVDGEVAARREVTLGFQEGDFVEVVSGVAPDERVVVVGQDGLSNGTPIQVLQPGAPAPVESASTGPPPQTPTRAPGGRRGPRDFSKMTPEQLAQAKEFMRARGMSDEQIEQRIKQAREESATE